MNFREFGRTGMKVSEIGFGAWAIGSTSYGPVSRADALAALACAEDLGCNFVDTALVYGNSEEVLGDFLRGRRDKWLVATKYSKQPAGMTATLEKQLRRLRTEAVDLYQIHWAPGRKDHHLYDELEGLKRNGKTRAVGVSLYSPQDIDYVLDHTSIDAIQVPFSLLDPSPFLLRRQQLASSGIGIIVRSALKEGFLTGKFRPGASFSDPADQRQGWEAARIERLVAQVESLRFLAEPAGSMVAAAVAYPLAFAEVSTVILGTKNSGQAAQNFGAGTTWRFDATLLQQVSDLQNDMDLLDRRSLRSFVKRLLGRA